MVVQHKDLKRLLLSPFYHIDETHLVYNMMSLLWKGIQLETSMGSAEFASMVATLVGMSQAVTLVLAKSLLFFDYEKAYYSEYAVGFSGVLFAMKVVLNSHSPDYSYVHGFMVPTRYAAWVELILIQIFVPGASFLGHLGGILAGILYLKFKRIYSGSDPLAIIFKGIADSLSWPLRFARRLFRRRQISGRGTVGRRQTRSIPWRCQACTYDNPGMLSICEMCGTARNGSGLSSHQWPRQSHELTLDELRRRRLERFGR